MKSSITKIGNLALEHIYRNKYDAMGYYERVFTISKDQFDLTIFGNELPVRSHKQAVYHISGVRYEIWGIRLGLKKLPLSSAIIFDVIADTVKKFKEIPSHIIVQNWSIDEYVGTKETYSVHRLTQLQELQLRKVVLVG